jgi:transcriptional regulatory protein LEU3
MAVLEQDFIHLSNEIADKLSGWSFLTTVFNVCHRFSSDYDLSATNIILLDSACLHLRVFYFLETSASDIRRRGLLKAYNTALALILKVQDADTTSNLMAYAPDNFYRVLSLAAIVLLKIINSSYWKYVDLNNGKHAFNSALSLIRRSSVEDNDLPARSSKILAQLWSIQSQHNRKMEEKPSLKLKTRSGASVVHDALWAWRETFGGQETGNPTSSGALFFLSVSRS